MTKDIDPQKLELTLNKILSTTRVACYMGLAASGVGLIVQTQLADWLSNPLTLLLYTMFIVSTALLSFCEFIWKRTILNYASKTERVHYFKDEEIN